MDHEPTQRTLKTWEITAISLGFMGPVMAMSLNGIGIAGLVGKSVPFTFCLAFIGTLLVAYSFIRLTGFIGHSGSIYALAGLTIGPRAGFFGGWVLLGTYICFSMCIVGACAVFGTAFFAELGIELDGQQWMFIAVFVLAIGLFLNSRESKITARFLLSVGFIGIASMLFLAIFILIKVGTDIDSAPVKTGIDFSVFTPGNSRWTTIITASVFAFLSWAGFESGSALGEETHNPTKIVPRSLLYAVVLGGITYIFVMFAVTIGFGTDSQGIAAFSSSSSALTELSTRYINHGFAVGMAAVAFCVALAAFLSSTAAASRLLYALARDDCGPRVFAYISKKHAIPLYAVWFCIILAVGSALALGLMGMSSVDIYYYLATIGTLCMVVAYATTSLGVIFFILQSRRAIPRYEIFIPILALCYLLFVYFIQIHDQSAPFTYFPYIAGAWCFLGIVIATARPRLAEKIGKEMRDKNPI
ncbi:APC family permease [Corynebacterium sp. sy039]|uniref:APC family permease n=1 Tax=Corynebacterium sp. sy039 TaxID=2599641 RepID=UPI0011B3A685|nr:APC family permease [Corynebacterium sp. sy039]QDZ42877.1 APC family permease [Corynebacterium sp. sy039]